LFACGIRRFLKKIEGEIKGKQELAEEEKLTFPSKEFILFTGKEESLLIDLKKMREFLDSNKKKVENEKDNDF
jgi:hypothetical protein